MPDYKSKLLEIYIIYPYIHLSHVISSSQYLFLTNLTQTSVLVGKDHKQVSCTTKFSLLIILPYFL